MDKQLRKLIEVYGKALGYKKKNIAMEAIDKFLGPQLDPLDQVWTIPELCQAEKNMYPVKALRLIASGDLKARKSASTWIVRRD